jgi:hypothetical protein
MTLLGLGGEFCGSKVQNLLVYKKRGLSVISCM